ncbi:MAG: hypothetical protein ACM3WV_00075 [Bacillota bacterium]
MKMKICLAIVSIGLLMFSHEACGAFSELSGEVMFDESQVNIGGAALGDHFRIIRFHGCADSPDYSLNLVLGYGFNPDLSAGEYSYQDLAYYLGIRMYNSDLMEATVIMGGYNKSVYEDVDMGGYYVRNNLAYSRGILIGFSQSFFLSERFSINGTYYGSFPYVRYDSTIERWELSGELKLEGGGFFTAGFNTDKFYQAVQISKVRGFYIGMGKRF